MHTGTIVVRPMQLAIAYGAVTTPPSPGIQFLLYAPTHPVKLLLDLSEAKVVDHDCDSAKHEDKYSDVERIPTRCP